jgi:hypothetical protein
MDDAMLGFGTWEGEMAAGATVPVAAVVGHRCLLRQRHFVLDGPLSPTTA